MQPDPKIPIRLLIVEDSEDDALLLVGCFRRAGYAPAFERVDNAEATRRALLAGGWDVVLSDHSMPGFDALAALALMQGLQLDLPFIIVSGVIEEETAIAAMRAGAHDYLSKERLDRLVPAVEREMREARNRAERRMALATVRENEARFRALVCNIPGMVFQLIRAADGAYRFSYVSDGVQALLGHAPAQLLASPGIFFDAIHDEDRPSFEKALADSANDLVQVNWDGRIVSGDGTEKWINLRSAPRRSADDAVQWVGIASNITQSKLTEMQLRESRARLAELSSHLEAVREEERERIARDIHDELGGILVAIKIETALLSNKPPADPLQLRRRMRAVESLVDEAIGTAGRVARQLRPGILKDFGLPAAIECHADDFTQRVGLGCDTSGISHEIEADEATSLAFFRIFQEALTNVAKHAGATWVGVKLGSDGDTLFLEIVDNGRGIAEEDLNKPKSFGLRGIRERMVGLGGTLEIGKNFPSGTRLTVRAPYKAAEPLRQVASRSV
jgi:PAS domain S-box-containing protein